MIPPQRFLVEMQFDPWLMLQMDDKRRRDFRLASLQNAQAMLEAKMNLWLQAQVASSTYATTPTITVLTNPIAATTASSVTFPQAQAQAFAYLTQTNATTWTTHTQTGVPCPPGQGYGFFDASGEWKIPKGWVGAIHLPDGSKVLGDGTSIRVEDDQAQVIYKAATRDFNKYLNGSDLVEEFIRYAGKLGARQRDVLKLPIDLFIAFLMIRSAEADGDPAPADVVLQLPKPARPRCVGCGRFIVPRPGITACSGAHLDRYLERIAA